jgi:hypothetical protein
MKIKTFKTFLIEDKNKAFNSFIEDVITTSKVSNMKAKDFLLPEYNYTGICYRVVFYPKANIEQYFSGETVDTKGITQFISANFNSNRYAFFTKSLQGMKALITYPDLFKIKEDIVGIIFSIKPKASIDLTKYSGMNSQIKDRLSKTEEILSFEDMTINNIDGMYLYDEEGWHFITDFNNRTKIISGGPRDDLAQQQDPQSDIGKIPEVSDDDLK